MCWQHQPVDRPSFTQIITMLVDYRLNKFIPNSGACQFWKSNFLTYNEIEKQKFLDVLWNDLEFSSVDPFLTKCLLNLLGSPSTVRLTHEFKNLVLWFLGTHGSWSQFLEILRSTFQCPYFFGSITYESAASFLHSCEPGTFLVRLNLGGRNPIEHHAFTITLKRSVGDIYNWSVVPGPKGGYLFTYTTGVQIIATGIPHLVDCLLQQFPDVFKKAALGAPYLEDRPMY
eukprot:TRINITY_DN250_c0_g2_i12.p1 TRINITY_DN250_c0_g2~~TRINITY_DN250_c0_g2_i12.p1  ORF type:complete len:229 (+),score=25.07 TRINITY_DN250_c0_g2_i12:1899-2585(+)